MELIDVINKYHIFDARKINELIPPSGVINVTITSPPYWNLKDYGTKNQIGHGQQYDTYLSDLENIFKKIYQMTMESGSLWIVSDTLKHKGKLKLLPFDLAKRLDNIGWILQDIIIWNKDRTLPWSHQGKLRNIFEYITFFSKSKRFTYHLDRVRDIEGIQNWWVRYPERYSPKGKAPARAWDFPIPRQGSWGNGMIRHFNPLPPKLIERILLLTTDKGGLVLDPFSGSGTVLAQSHIMDRDFIGLDLNKEYKRMFKSGVLPTAINTHNATMADIKIKENKKRSFERLILYLRKVKYPKEFIRIYRRNIGELNVKAILVLKKTRTTIVDITFIFSEISAVPPNFKSNIYEISSIPPLSKYGLSPEFSIETLGGLSKRWLDSKGLAPNKTVYVYVGGRTYTWDHKLPIGKIINSIKELELEQIKDKSIYPQIISNINVKVNPASPSNSIKG